MCHPIPGGSRPPKRGFLWTSEEASASRTALSMSSGSYFGLAIHELDIPSEDEGMSDNTENLVLWEGRAVCDGHGSVEGATE